MFIIVKYFYKNIDLTLGKVVQFYVSIRKQ